MAVLETIIVEAGKVALTEGAKIGIDVAKKLVETTANKVNDKIETGIKDTLSKFNPDSKA